MQPEQLVRELQAEQPVGQVVHVLVPTSAMVPVGQDPAATQLPIVLSKKPVRQEVQVIAEVQLPQGFIHAVQVPVLLKYVSGQRRRQLLLNAK